MLTRLQRRSVAHLPCRGVAELALTARIAHLPLHPLVPHPVVRHLVALQAVATVVRNESQTLDGLARADPGYGIGVAKALGIELSEEVVRNLMSASTSDGELVAAEVPSSH